MNGSTNVLAIAGDISLLGLRAITSRADEEGAAEGTGTCDMEGRVRPGSVGIVSRFPAVRLATSALHRAALRTLR